MRAGTDYDSHKSKATALGSVIALRSEEELFIGARSVRPLVIQLRAWGQGHRATREALLVHTERMHFSFRLFRVTLTSKTQLCATESAGASSAGRGGAVFWMESARKTVIRRSLKHSGYSLTLRQVSTLTQLQL